MGKFDGVLFASDFDGTLARTAQGNHYDISISPENRRAIEAFIAEGGTFVVASGRGHLSFRDYASMVPFNGPCIFANGAEIYDFTQEKTIQSFPLPPFARTHLAELLEHFPTLALEFYCPNDQLFIVRPNHISRSHLAMLNIEYTQGELADAPQTDWYKILIEQEHEILAEAKDFINSRWSEHYECMFSHSVLLELNAKGASKGDSVLWLADHLSIDRAHIYCMGDNENDLSMLQISAIPFAPKNAVPAVQALPGLRLLPHHNDHAVAAALVELNQIYS